MSRCTKPVQRAPRITSVARVYVFTNVMRRCVMVMRLTKLCLGVGCMGSVGFISKTLFSSIVTSGSGDKLTILGKSSTAGMFAKIKTDQTHQNIGPYSHHTSQTASKNKQHIIKSPTTQNPPTLTNRAAHLCLGCHIQGEISPPTARSDTRHLTSVTRSGN